MYILTAKSKIKSNETYTYGPFDSIKDASNFIGMLDVSWQTFEITRLLRPTANAD